MPLGVNLCFAVKRMPEPRRWAAFGRCCVGLKEAGRRRRGAKLRWRARVR